MYPLFYSANKKPKASNPGPDNYSSSNNIGRHYPAWKYTPTYSESAAHLVIATKSSRHLDLATTISKHPNQDQK
jgi:hypothetical protein